MIKFKDLTQKMKAIVRKKAEDNDVSVTKYLSSADKNYCIRSNDGGEIVTWGNNDPCDYVVYGDMSDAQCDLSQNESIITEEEAIRILNDMERENLKH